MPHRAPGSPGRSRQQFLSGKPIRYYRPKGSAEIRHLIDEGFQAFNAGRLSEACQIFAEKMLAPEHDTTIGLTMAGALTPAGLGGCVIELMDRGLVDFVISHRREPLPRSALRAELHAAPRLAVRGRRASCTRRASSGSTTCCFRRPCCSRPTPTSATSSSARGLNEPISTAEFHYRLGRDLLERYPGCEEHSVVARAAPARRADLHLVARRQLDRHEHRVSRADERQPAHDRSEQGRQRGLRDRAGRQEERLRDPRRRIAEELLPAGAADAVGGLRHPEGRQRLLHPDHDRLRSCGAGCRARRRRRPSAGAR